MPDARSQLDADVVQEPGHANGLLDDGDCEAVDAGGVGASLAGDPVERLGLHFRYP